MRAVSDAGAVSRGRARAESLTQEWENAEQAFKLNQERQEKEQIELDAQTHGQVEEVAARDAALDALVADMESEEGGDAWDDGWVIKTAESLGRKYWFNTETHESVWIKEGEEEEEEEEDVVEVEEDDAAEDHGAAATEAQEWAAIAASEGVWEERMDADSDTHTRTRSGVWERPDDGSVASSTAVTPSSAADDEWHEDDTESKDEGEWEEHLDPDSGKPYFTHTRTRSSVWERPDSVASSSVATPSSAADGEWHEHDAESKDEGEWEEHLDPDSGRAYFTHTRTRSSVWERPGDLVASSSAASTHKHGGGNDAEQHQSDWGGENDGNGDDDDDDGTDRRPRVDSLGIGIFGGSSLDMNDGPRVSGGSSDASLGVGVFNEGGNDNVPWVEEDSPGPADTNVSGGAATASAGEWAAEADGAGRAAAGQDDDEGSKAPPPTDLARSNNPRAVSGENSLSHAARDLLTQGIVTRRRRIVSVSSDRQLGGGVPAIADIEIEHAEVHAESPVSAEGMYKKRLLAFYKNHRVKQPKMSKIDKVLATHRGKEEVLFQALEKKYAHLRKGGYSAGITV